MIFLDLFIGFLKVGCFAFGGAYGAIPLIRDVVLSYGWLTDEALSYMIAVAESTPGPIMVNLATYVGSTQGGLLGALLATFAVILPAFIIVIVLMFLLKNIFNNRYVQAVLKGMTPCVIGIVFATGIFMCLKNLMPMGLLQSFDVRGAIIAAILIGVMAVYKRLKKKKLSPIIVIIISAVLGIAAYSV